MAEAGHPAGAPRLLWPAGAQLGEGPLWDDRAGLLYWLDIEGRRLLRCDARGAAQRIWNLPSRIGCAVLTEAPDGALLLGLETGLHLFDPDANDGDGGLEFLAAPDPNPPGTRPNDGKVDAAGRLWFGTMDCRERPGAGALHRLDRDGRCRTLARGWTIPNGPAFAPDGTRLFWTDSARRCVFVIGLGAGGEPQGDPRPFIRFAEDEAGVPDGMTVDAEGCLWLAQYGGGCVARHAPDGGLLARIPIPAHSVTSCTLGGTGLSTLFVTTARQDARPGETMAAGALFAIDTATRGLPAGRLQRDAWGQRGNTRAQP